MFELITISMIAFIAWHLGYEVAEEPFRNLMVVLVALACAGLTAATHMTVNGWPIAVFIAALAAGLLGKMRARKRAFKRLRDIEDARERHFSVRKEVK